jgi:hypothetical protein
MDEDGFKQCPFCKERIRAAAVKCRFCGEWLESKPPLCPGTADQPDVVPVPGGAGEASSAESSGLRMDVPQEGGTLVDRESAPPVVASTPSKKWSWEFTPRVLNWISCGLLAFCVITMAVVLRGSQFNQKAVDKLVGAIGRILICAGLFAWMARKGGKGYGLLTFSLVCTGGVLVFAYYFHVGRESAKQENRHWAGNALDFYTNAMEFVQQGGTGSVPGVKLTGDPVNDSTIQLMRDFMSGIATRFGRMNDEIDALGKREVFEDAVLTSKDALADEIRKRGDSLKVLENYRGGLASIVAECKSKLGVPGLNEDQRREILQGVDNSLKSLEPKYNSVLDARAKKDRADEQLLSFLWGAFKDYRLKDGKILFPSDKNLAKYKELAKQVTDASDELHALVKRFMGEAEAGKSRIRAIGGIDGGVKR